MSLLTDALRLREGRRPARSQSGLALPPLYGARRGPAIFLVVGVAVLAGLGFFFGEWVLVKMEELAGISTNRMTPARLAQMEARKKEVAQPEGVQKEAVLGGKVEAKPEVSVVEVGPARLDTGMLGGLKRDAVKQGGVAEEKDAGKGAEAEAGSEVVAGERRDELKKSVEVPAERVAVALREKAEAGVGTMTEGKRWLEKSGVEGAGKTAGQVAPAGAEVKAGGLKTMKVELAEAELATVSPEESDRRRVDRVETFLRSLQVQGVRLQGKDSRILVDGVPIGLGEKVGSMGLVLEGVEPQKLIFSDAGGKKYRKNY